MYQGSELNSLDKHSFLLPHQGMDTMDLLLCKDSKDHTLLSVYYMKLGKNLKAPVHHLYAGVIVPIFDARTLHFS
jgi:hypothetical protein